MAKLHPVTGRRSESGTALILGVLGLMFVIPFTGLSVDVAVLYNVRVQLQGSVDGASLAAARVLNVGQTTDAQAAAAKQNAVNWFYANFPSGRWATASTQMDTTTVNVFDDPVVPHVRNVTVVATTVAPTYFMKWFGIDGVPVRASGNASRRDVAVMMVIDISGSMTGACAQMRSAAKQFTGQFAAGRDSVGMLTFNHAIASVTSPTTNFQTVLGYSNSLGTGTGQIDSMTCGTGGTGTSQAISLAWNELYKLQYVGALNVMLLETDGMPNELTLNQWDSGTSKAGISSGSGCRDKNSKTISGGGFASTSVLPAWTTAPSTGTGTYYTSLPTGIAVGTIAGDPSQSHFVETGFAYYGSAAANTVNPVSASGCAFSGGTTTDMAWWPLKDIYGNQLYPATNPYQAVTVSGGHVSNSGWTNFHASALNAADDAAHTARNNTVLPVYFFVIGLSGNGDIDYTLLQRMANDPNGDLYSGSNYYLPCSQNASCVNYPNENIGTLVASSNATALARGFLIISSQILRLSK